LIKQRTRSEDTGGDVGNRLIDIGKSVGVRSLVAEKN
jgi:hypothetical protein